jgi:NADPH2:quinone reductase
MADGTTMLAMVTDDYGAALHLAERPRPEPGPGEVLVRVQAASVNGFDVAVAAGRLRGMMEHSFPAGVGKDFAGTVEAIGEGVSGFAAGDRVFGVVMKPTVRDGSFAQYVTVPEAIGIAHLPDRLDVSVAGALGLAGTAAIQALDALQLLAGELVLVAGATGGGGALAVQLAAASGAVVIATGQPGPDEKFFRELGATHVADYREDLAGAVRAVAPKGVDAALHLAGDGSQHGGPGPAGRPAGVDPGVQPGAGRRAAALGDRGDGQPRRPDAGPAGDPGHQLSPAGAGAGDLPAGGAAAGPRRLYRGTRGKLAISVP